MAILLVVDRSLTQRQLLRILLEAHQHEVIEARSAAEARRCIADSRPDAVLLAWELDDAQAPELLRSWSADPALRFVPILMVTGHEQPERLREALELGAMDYLSKPVEELELLARVATALRERAMKLELHQLATCDFLTGLVNRRELLLRVNQEWHRSRRYKTPVTVALLDVDRFKQVNDNLGHDVGDAVLCQLAKLLVAGVREIDTVGRYGGEEFLILFPETASEGALVCMQRLLEAARDATWAAPQGVTFSAGLTTINGEQEISAALRVADEALYRAKAQGRNRIELAASGL